MLSMDEIFLSENTAYPKASSCIKICVSINVIASSVVIRWFQRPRVYLGRSLAKHCAFAFVSISLFVIDGRSESRNQNRHPFPSLLILGVYTTAAASFPVWPAWTFLRLSFSLLWTCYGPESNSETGQCLLFVGHLCMHCLLFICQGWPLQFCWPGSQVDVLVIMLLHATSGTSNN